MLFFSFQVELVILPRSIITDNPQEQQNQPPPPPPPPPPQNEDSGEDQNEEEQEVVLSVRHSNPSSILISASFVDCNISFYMIKAFGVKLSI